MSGSGDILLQLAMRARPGARTKRVTRVSGHGETEVTSMRVKRRTGVSRRAAWVIAFCGITQAFSSNTHAQAKQGQDADAGYGTAPTALTAQTADSDKARSEEYQSLVQQALHEYQLGNFNEAKVFFGRAHALSPNARTLRGLGMSSYELRNYVEAIDYFQRSLSSNERPLTLQMHGELSQLLNQARSFVTRVRLRLVPNDAELRVDTRTIPREPDGSVLLDPGTHELTIEAPAHETVTRTIRTNGAETLSLNVTLRAQEQEQDDTTPTRAVSLSVNEDKAAQGALEPQGHGDGDAGVAPWILIGAGGAVAIAGGVMLAIALGNKYDVEHPQTQGAVQPVYADYKDKADSVFPLSVGGIAALSLGAASIACGLVWKFTASGRPEHASTQLQLGPGHVQLRMRF